MKFYAAIALVTHIIPIIIIFMPKCTILNINCQHNAYLESIKISIIGKNWGNAKSICIMSKLWSIIDSSLMITTKHKDTNESRYIASAHVSF